MPPPLEAGLHLSVTQRCLPGKLPARVRLQVELIELLDSGLDSLRQLALRRSLTWPVTRGEHVNVDFHPFSIPRRPRNLLVPLHSVLANSHIVEHPLELAGELVAALRLELRDHDLFTFIAYALPTEKPLRKARLVEALEDVLVLEVAEYGDGLVKPLIRLLLPAPLQPAPHKLVNVDSEVVSTSAVCVDEVLEGLLDLLPRLLLAPEGVLDDGVVLVPHLQDALNEHDRVLHSLLVLDELPSGPLDVFANSGPQDVDRGRDETEEVEHVPELLDLAILEHCDNSGLVHVDQGLRMSCYQLGLDDAHELGLGSRAEVVGYPALLLV
mmetsp:Transcript_22729/g.45366  ORF Transcript_22729/g.45366 Transcript_22729/m.45366 type:complete len:326 (-) Transcript_22729:234-1211(-)